MHEDVHSTTRGGSAGAAGRGGVDSLYSFARERVSLDFKSACMRVIDVVHAVLEPVHPGHAKDRV